MNMRTSVCCLFTIVSVMCSTAVFASSLTGNWSGSVSSGAESENVVLQFSADGNFVNSYGELTHVGQIQQLVPAGGGVLTVKVTKFNKQDDALLVEQEVSFEKSSNGYLQQDYAVIKHEVSLIPEGLSVKLTVRGSSYTSDIGGSAGGDGDAVVATGVLTKTN